MKASVLISILIITFNGSLLSMDRTSPLIIDHTCLDIYQIPSEWIDKVQSDLKWHYAHTSHGRQLLKGLELIENDDPAFSQAVAVSALPTEEGAFCIFDGQEGGDNYIAPKEYWSTEKGMNKTRNVLNHNPSLNMSQFCWCGELQHYTEAEVQAYLDSISVLEAEFPGVTFIYMTGNAQVQGSEGYNRYLRNEQIRQFCRDNNKVLFDFADLDAWWFNPDTQQWEHETYQYSGVTIQTEHPHFNGDEYAHTTYESCRQKGKAVWWMAARLMGWTSGQSENIPPSALPDSSSCDEDDQCQIDVLSNDSDSDGVLVPSTVTIAGQPTNGVITQINSTNGIITYKPDADYFGTDTFSYTVADDSGAVSAPATVSVRVLPVNDAPESFSLWRPLDGDTLNSLSEPIDFIWRQAQDADGDELFYTLKIFNNQTDTTIENISDTTFIFNDNEFCEAGQTYFWTALVADTQYSVLSGDTFSFTMPSLEAIDIGTQSLPVQNRLYSNYPNPFNPATTITYRLLTSGQVELAVFNLLGEKVVTLVNERQSAGEYAVKFHADGLASGVYLYKLTTANGFSQVNKMILMR